MERCVWGVKPSEGFERDANLVSRENHGHLPVRSTEFQAPIQFVELQLNFGEVGEVPQVIERSGDEVLDRGATHRQPRTDRNQQVIE